MRTNRDIEVSQPIIVAAHPTDMFDEGTESLLRQAAGTPVICLNPHGSSDAPASTLEAMVDEIEAERHRRGIERWVFWGMSGGGWLGQLYARRFPQATAGLILESTCSCFRTRLADPGCILSPFNAAWRPELDARGLVAANSHDDVGDVQATEWTEVPGVGSVFRRAHGPALLAAPMAIGPAMKRMMPALWSFDSRAWLAGLRAPTLVVGGSGDLVAPPSHVRELHRAIDGAKLVVVDGAGHVPVSEHRPEVGEAVRRFLEKI